MVHILAARFQRPGSPFGFPPCDTRESWAALYLDVEESDRYFHPDGIERERCRLSTLTQRRWVLAVYTDERRGVRLSTLMQGREVPAFYPIAKERDTGFLA
jgi:hypothetical protein